MPMVTRVSQVFFFDVTLVCELKLNGGTLRLASGLPQLQNSDGYINQIPLQVGVGEREREDYVALGGKALWKKKRSPWVPGAKT